MDTLPDFVTDQEERPRTQPVARTGWESVRFQLVEEEEPPSDSDFSTAALAP